MTTPSAFRAAFADMKLVKTRQVAQLIFEIPMEEFDAAYEVLGGLPNPSMERWFGIAAIVAAKELPAPEKPKRDWVDLQPQQQAGIRCSEQAFMTFLREQHPDDWAECTDAVECVRLICGVHSRVELGTNQKARVIWHNLDAEFQAWRAIGGA